MIQFFIATGSFSAFAGVIARSLSSHALKPLLLERDKLDNFNLAADYLVLHGLAIIGIAILIHLFPDAKFHRAGFAFIAGSLLFQVSVLAKSFISIAPLGFITPLGGGILMMGWVLMIFSALAHTNHNM